MEVFSFGENVSRGFSLYLLAKVPYITHKLGMDESKPVVKDGDSFRTELFIPAGPTNLLVSLYIYKLH